MPLGYVLIPYIEDDDLPVFGNIKDLIIKQDFNDTHIHGYTCII